MERDSVGVTIMVNQNQEIRRIPNATIIIKGTSRKSVRKTYKMETIKLSHQILRALRQILLTMAKLSTAREQLL